MASRLSIGSRSSGRSSNFPAPRAITLGGGRPSQIEGEVMSTTGKGRRATAPAACTPTAAVVRQVADRRPSDQAGDRPEAPARLPRRPDPQAGRGRTAPADAGRRRPRRRATDGDHVRRGRGASTCATSGEVRQIDARTLADYRGVVDGYLLEEFGDSPLEAITPDLIDAYKERLIAEGKLSNRTIVRHLTVLHGIFKRAKRVYGTGREPGLGRSGRAPEGRSTRASSTPSTRDEVELLAADADDAQDAAIYRVAAFTGLRQGELLALRWSRRRLRRTGCSTSAATSPAASRRCRRASGSGRCR